MLLCCVLRRLFCVAIFSHHTTRRRTGFVQFPASVQPPTRHKRNVPPNMSGDEKDPLQQDVQAVMPNTEASDLRELHLSANFLTPYAVAPTQDNKVWLTNTQQAYVDHSKKVRSCFGANINSELPLAACVLQNIRVGRRPYGLRALAYHGANSGLRNQRLGKVIRVTPIIGIIVDLTSFVGLGCDCSVLQHLGTSTASASSLTVFYPRCFLTVRLTTAGIRNDMAPVVVKKTTDMVRACISPARSMRRICGCEASEQLQATPRRELLYDSCRRQCIGKAVNIAGQRRAVGT